MNIYGLLIGVAIVLAIELYKKYYNYLSYLNILCILLFTLLGARLLYILHNISEIKQTIINPLAIWDGGLAFYGGLTGLLISLWILSKYKKIKPLKLSDSILLFLPLIHAIGRIGNFFNYELYGTPTTLPWGMYVPVEYRVDNLIQYTHFHPVFLYEALLNILNFIILIFLNTKSKKAGVITGIYLINYSLIRLLMNTLRIDKEYFLGIETSNIFSIIFLLSGILLIVMKDKKLKRVLANLLSREVTLSLIMLAIISVLLNSKVSLQLNTLLALFTVVLPISIIILFKKLGITSDLNVSKREERPKLFLLIAISFLISLYISLSTSQPLLITVYTTLNLSFLIGLILTLFWKVSFHMIWSTLSIFFILYSWQVSPLYLLTLLLPLVGWSRVYLKKHTALQVVVGFLLTVLCIFSVLTLLKF